MNENGREVDLSGATDCNKFYSNDRDTTSNAKTNIQHSHGNKMNLIDICICLLSHRIKWHF